jgi:hypothetical protein
MSTWDEVFQIENLRRAWRWVRSNPDAQFKAYFRELYTLYAIADDTLLTDLQRRLRRQVYQPKPACKLFLPKPSGILRPYTLLTIEDQVAYQAAVNVIAELLFPRARHRYNKEVFGHLYAGKTSQWFYRKWSDGYALFNGALRKAFADGYRVTASFDLTACYDSLDHGVLRQFLEELHCDSECCRVFTGWLSAWTATDARYYHNHGIPQGPQPSGLVAEVVLQHFDSHRGRERRVRYFRYVDDIRMFAKTERELRQMLVRLDMLSKDIGLFPQSSKIDIHEVKDIETELKSLSNPVESVVKRTSISQERLRKRIVALSPRFKVSDSTRFKYLLGRALPNSELTNRLWHIYEKAPAYYPNIARYLCKYKRLPRAAARRLLKEIKRQTLYPAICAEFVQTLDGRVPRPLVAKADSLLKEMWKPATLRPTLLAAVGRYLLRRDRLTFNQAKYACQHPKSWWARSQLVLCLSDRLFGKPSLAWLANRALRDHYAEVAMAAASLVLRENIPVERPRRRIHSTAAKMMKKLGIIQRVRLEPCGIHLYLTRLVGVVPEIRWRAFFGADHVKVESHAVFCRACMETNITAWVNAMDVFNDWLLGALYRHDKSLGAYSAIGSVIGSTKLSQKYPDIHAMVKSVHEKRYGSALSHAKERRTGRPTQPVKFAYLKTAKKLVRVAIVELSAKWGVS